MSTEAEIPPVDPCCEEMAQWAMQGAIGYKGLRTADRRGNVRFRFCPYCGSAIEFRGDWIVGRVRHAEDKKV